MKDLTQKDGSGVYYMNSFLGIEEGWRPLTMHSITYQNKLVMSIPTINSKYTSNDFFIKVHQLKSHYEQNDMFKFKGLCRFRVYTYNQEIMSVLQHWSGLNDAKGRLHHDIRISSKNNSFYLEQWEKNRCTQRLIVTHFHLKQDPASRNMAESNNYIDYRPDGAWLILT
jgi:hypothetical protein